MRVPSSQIQHSDEAKKRNVDDSNPTLYWEYKWTEGSDAEVRDAQSKQF